MRVSVKAKKREAIARMKEYKEDKEIAKMLADAGKVIGIPLLDHIIMGGHKYYSFMEQGIIPDVD